MRFSSVAIKLDVMTRLDLDSVLHEYVNKITARAYTWWMPSDGSY